MILGFILVQCLVVLLSSLLTAASLVRIGSQEKNNICRIHHSHQLLQDNAGNLRDETHSECVDVADFHAVYKVAFQGTTVPVHGMYLQYEKEWLDGGLLTVPRSAVPVTYTEKQVLLATTQDSPKRPSYYERRTLRAR